MHSGNGCGLCKIAVSDIGVKKGGDVLLNGVSFELHCGELTALIGVNGAGKTTLIKAILGEVKHEGKVSYESHNGEKLDKITVGYVPQHLEFDRSAPVSVEDFLRIGRSKAPVCFGKGRAFEKEIDASLEKVGCEMLKKRMLGELSGGETQRVMLANALYPLPELLVLDEPVSGVDVKGSEKFYDVISALRQDFHISIFMVSHDLGIIREYADKVILLNRSVLKMGTADEVFSSPEFRTSFFYGMD